MRGNIHILGGGTFSDVRSHLSLAARAFGGTARDLTALFNLYLPQTRHPVEGFILPGQPEVKLHLTKMADHRSTLITNRDVNYRLEAILDDPATAVVIMNVALCDYNGTILEDGQPTPSGSHAERLKSRHGEQTMRLTPATKLLGKIKNHRPDVIAVGFKTTAGADETTQVAAAQAQLAEAKSDFVFGNDVVTRQNLLLGPMPAQDAAERQYLFMDRNRRHVLHALVREVIATWERRDV
ncbi:hypothetical protein CcrC1_gp053c [Caulobacter phage C1]|nr:hypothetical protein CcrC1_gp053c [Caulobacter phage C1]UTU08280.1 hypothetical protein CcrC2_gp052c [Caulobacter phage C2]UTU08803.1 hypothetical protein CcrJ4_gp052c [Caulobacter phage J4]UTU09355.1 hypothetical protein CcrBL47_gp069c [Caulobacter phage BL47]UTU09915.1 hypothetical protein CcrRB23_gp053c [Caulobacter phage RB23]WGN96940.1 hypothetical protein [Bertelyvirus sp.]